MGICFILNVVYSANNSVKIFILKTPKVAHLMLKLICGQFGETWIQNVISQKSYRIFTELWNALIYIDGYLTHLKIVKSSEQPAGQPLAVIIF